MLAGIQQKSRSLAARSQALRLFTDLNAPDTFGPPPATVPRRVVVTGLGLVTPLAVGVAQTWERLLAGDTGVTGLRPQHLPQVHAVYCMLRNRLHAMRSYGLEMEFLSRYFACTEPQTSI